MASLSVSLAGIPERGARIDVAVPVQDLRPRDAETLPIERVRVRGVVLPVDTEYVFEGRLEGDFVHTCDRCLEQARVPVALEVTWLFEEGPPSEPLVEPDELDDASEDAAERRTFQGNELDLGPHVWEELVLAAPFKYLCRPDCKGLCAACGANLNRGPCACRTEPDTPLGDNKGFARLKELFPDLSPEKTED